MALKDGLGGGTGLANIQEEINVNTIVTGSNRIYFRDAGISIRSDTDGRIIIESDDKISVAAAGSDDDSIKLDGPTTVLLGDTAGSEALTIKDSDEFPMNVQDSDGNIKHKGIQRRTLTG